MRYVLGETLQEYQEEIMEKDRPSDISGDIADCQRLPGTGRHAV